MASRKRLNSEEHKEIGAHIDQYGLSDDSDLEEPFQDSGSEYEPSESDLELCSRKRKANGISNHSTSSQNLRSSSSNDSSDNDSSESYIESEPENNNAQIESQDGNGRRNSNNPNIHWTTNSCSFIPAKSIPKAKTPNILHSDITYQSSEIDCFLKLFPKSLFIFISQCTNERLKILGEINKKAYAPTDQHEIMLVLGCYIVMAYNKVPSMANYWSSNKSLGNEAIKASISRDRFFLLTSKMYYNHPARPENSEKLYYISEVMSCLKHTFRKARSDSTFQSIDESMVKFKGRSALKQYLPLKPIKRGIKVWERCDSRSGYIYDMNIYSGKDVQQEDDTLGQGLGERVVNKLCRSISDPDVMLCFDRFFTTTSLMANLEFAAVGTCMSNRKNVPKFEKQKMKKGDSQSLFSNVGVAAYLWKDSKEVTVLSNCHSAETGSVERRQKDGTKIAVPCPQAIKDYNSYMGGVDLSDQLSGLYDIDRKSQKWWRKVFYKLLLTAATNAWILFKESHKRDLPFVVFLVNLAESLINSGRKNAGIVRKRKTGRPTNSSRNLVNVGDHLPIQSKTRRRCHSCASRKMEKRTKTICTGCNIPLCNNCFSTFHT